MQQRVMFRSALLFLVGAIVLIAIQQATSVGSDKELNRYRMGWLVIIIGLSVSAFTVHFWNAMFTYFFFLIGTGVWMTAPATRLPKILFIAQLASLMQQPTAVRRSQGI